MNGESTGASLAHDRRGEGESLVLIHGTGSRWQVFVPLLPYLATHRDVVCPDMPGFGESPDDGTEPTVDALSSRLERFFEEIGVQRPHVGGNSLGGAVSLELVRRGSARSATVFSPAGFWAPKEAQWAARRIANGQRDARRMQRLIPVLARFSTMKCLFGRHLYGRPWRQPTAEVIGTAMAAISSTGLLPATQVFSKSFYRADPQVDAAPVLVAWGVRDMLLPVRQATRAERLLPNARHVRLPGCGHVPFYDDPALCAALLLEGSASGR